MVDFKAALQKPWVRYTAGGVAVLGVLWIVLKHSSGGSAGGTSTTIQQSTDPALASLEAQRNALQQHSADQQSAQSFALADDTIKAGSALSLARLTGQVNAQEQANQITGTLNLAQLQTQGQENLSSIAAATARANIIANENVATLGMQRDVIQQAAMMDTERALAATAAHTTELQISSNAQVNTRVSDNNANVAMHVADTTSTTALGLAHIAGDVATAQSHDTTAAQIAIAQANAGASMHNSDNAAGASNTSSWLGAVGSIATAAMMFL